MSSVAEIEKAIALLSREEFAELEGWFEGERNRKWDGQIEEDARSGKLDALYERLRAENRDVPDLPLDDFLDQEKLS